MKKIITLVLAVLFGITMFAQCPLTEAVDFTATDIEGNEWNLFEILDGGQYVLIDFFYTTCGPCQQTAPKVAGAFTYFGCNSADVIMLGINTGDTDAQVLAFDLANGAIYPSISGVEGGGSAIVNTYQIPAFPTIILIAPDHSIVVQDLWPITNAQTIIDVLEPYGITEHECPFVGILEPTAEMQMTTYPNPVSETLTVNLQNCPQQETNVVLFDAFGRNISSQTIPYSEYMSASFNVSEYAEGAYWVNVYSNDQRICTKKVLVVH